MVRARVRVRVRVVSEHVFSTFLYQNRACSLCFSSSPYTHVVSGPAVRKNAAGPETNTHVDILYELLVGVA